MMLRNKLIWKTKYLILLVVFMFLFNSVLAQGSLSVSREFPNGVVLDEVADVILDVNVDESNMPYSFIIEEFVPNGWEVVGATEEYLFFDEANSRVSWLFSPNGLSVQDVTITYQVVPKNYDNVFSSNILVAMARNSSVDAFIPLKIQGETEAQGLLKIIEFLETLDADSTGYKLVIGTEGTAEDNIAAIDVSGRFGLGKPFHDYEVNLDENLIVIGGPCVNVIAYELMDSSYCTEGFEEGEGLIKLFENNGYYQLLIAGHSAIDTRIAARIVTEYSQHREELGLSYAITSGVSLDDFDVEKSLSSGGYSSSRYGSRSSYMGNVFGARY